MASLATVTVNTDGTVTVAPATPADIMAVVNPVVDAEIFSKIVDSEQRQFQTLTNALANQSLQLQVAMLTDLITGLQAKLDSLIP